MKYSLIWLIFSGIIFMQGRISAENLIKNGNFSQSGSQGIPAHWTAFKSPIQAEGREDKNIFLNAPVSLRLENPTEKKRTRFLQDFTVAPGKDYIFSFYVKGDKITGKNGVRALLTRQNGKWITGGSKSGLWKYMQGTFDWEKCEFKFTSPEDGKLRISLTLLDAKGTAWFDVVSITEIKKTTTDSFPATGRLFPVAFQKEPYTVCANIPGMLLLDIEGDSKTLLKKGVKMELILPKELYFIGASPAWPYKTGNMPYPTCIPEKVSTKKENHYVFDINPNILKKVKNKGYQWHNFDRIFIGTRSENTGREMTVKWRLLVGDEKGPEHSFAVKILNPVNLENIKCKAFSSIIMEPISHTAPFPEVVNAYRKFWTSLSKYPRAGQPFMLRGRSPEFRDNFLKTYKVCQFFSASRLFKITSEKYKDRVPSLIMADGKANPSRVEPYYLVDDPEGIIWDKAFPESVKAQNGGYFDPEILMFDYEPRVMAFGFSPENRERFTKYAKLASVPSIEAIKAQYRKQWISFRRYQNSLVIKKFCEAVHRHFPNTKAALATDPLNSPGNMLSSWCCTDPRLSDKDVDLFMNMPYYAGLRFYETVELNSKLLKSKSFPLIDPSEQLESFFERYNGSKIKQNIIVTAALGNIGIGFWPTDCLDANYLTSIADGFSVVKAVEDIYSGDRCDKSLRSEVLNTFSQTVLDEGKECVINYPNFKKDIKLLMHKKDGEYVITALNYDPLNAAIIKAAIPEFKSGEFQVADAVSRKRLPDLDAEKICQGFLFSVPAGGVTVVKIGNIKFKTEGMLSQASLEKENRTMLAEFKKNKSFKTLAEGTAKISWSTIPGRNLTPALKIQNGRNKIYIDITKDGANIIVWLNTKTKDPLRFREDYGLLGDFRLYGQQNHGPYSFKLTDMKIENGIPEVLFSYEVKSADGANPETNPLQGLVISKRISVPHNDSVNIEFTLTNRSPYKKAMDLGFRVRNVPYVGAFFSGRKAPVEFTTLSWNKNRIKPTEHMMYLKKGCEIDFLPQIKRCTWKPGSLTASAQDGAFRESFKFEADKMAGFFVWRAAEMYTVELLFAPFSIPYEKTYKWNTKITAGND